MVWCNSSEKKQLKVRNNFGRPDSVTFFWRRFLRTAWLRSCVNLSQANLAFMYASGVARAVPKLACGSLERCCWPWLCRPAAISNTTERSRFLYISALATTPLYPDGQWYRRSTNCGVTLRRECTRCKSVISCKCVRPGNYYDTLI